MTADPESVSYLPMPTDSEIRRQLRAEVTRLGGFRKAGKVIGCSHARLHQILNGDPPNALVLAHLGYESTIVPIARPRASQPPSRSPQ